MAQQLQRIIRTSTKKPARERLHSQTGFSTLLPKIVEASGLGASPCLLVIVFRFVASPREAI